MRPQGVERNQLAHFGRSSRWQAAAALKLTFAQWFYGAWMVAAGVVCVRTEAVACVRFFISLGKADNSLSA
jgi:hypothetical protein